MRLSIAVLTPLVSFLESINVHITKKRVIPSNDSKKQIQKKDTTTKL